MDPIQKRCTKCDQLKSLESFYVRRSGLHTGKSLAQCKKCYDDYAKRWCANNRERRRLKHDERVFECRYKITYAQYFERLREQAGVCAICSGINKNGRRLDVDHNHQTGKIRGLLCTYCNTRLAAIENTNFLTKALQYLGRNHA